MRRILDLSGATSQEIFRLRVDKGCLLVAHGAMEQPEDVRIPTPEVGVLVLGPRLALTGAVLGHVAASGGVVLVLDDRFRPSGLMLPTAVHTDHVRRLHLQIERTASLAPGSWRQIVRAKIAAQAALVRSDRADLLEWVDRVEPGDPKNVEATVARLYFPRVFGEGFERRGDDPRSSMLDYGYAVLRALVARAICAAGLHPALGLHHRSARDPFALADDLMEPARPIVDGAVSRLAGLLDASAKRTILAAMLSPVRISGETYKLIEAYERVAQSWVRVLERGSGDLDLPSQDAVA